MVVSPRCLERGSSLRLRHTINVRDDRPPSKQAARSAPPNSAVASAACLEGRPGARYPIYGLPKLKKETPMPLLHDHIAVVTGAGSGIGRAIASGYARE